MTPPARLSPHLRTSPWGPPPAAGGSPRRARQGPAARSAGTVKRRPPRGASPQLNPVAQLDAAGNLEWRYVYASKPNVPDYAIRVSDGAVYRIVSDQLGSVVLVVNASDASDILLAAQYSAFGEQTVLQGDADAVPFGFAGGIYDPATGLTRFGARDYDPETGRWTSKEPLGFAGALNFYVYAAGDPVNLVDPTGLAPSNYELIWRTFIQPNLYHSSTTAVGVAYAVLTGAEFKGIEDGALVFEGGYFESYGYDRTIGDVICYENADRSSKPHETAHTWQHDYLGVFYLPLHLGFIGGSYVLTGDYDNHPLEYGPNQNPPRAFW